MNHDRHLPRFKNILLVITVIVVTGVITNLFFLSNYAYGATSDLNNNGLYTKMNPKENVIVKSISSGNIILRAVYPTGIIPYATSPIALTSPAKSIPPFWIPVLSYIVSAAIVAGIFIFVAFCLKGKDMVLSDIIRDGSGFPSLARFQFLLWTFIIMFAGTIGLLY